MHFYLWFKRKKQETYTSITVNYCLIEINSQIKAPLQSKHSEQLVSLFEKKRVEVWKKLELD